MSIWKSLMAAASKRLLDASGQPVEPASLPAEQETESAGREPAERAGATLTGVRSAISEHPAEGLTPRRLAQIHREAAQGDPLRYLELAEDIEERDLHYFGVLGTRKRSVAQLPITVEPASDAADHKQHAEYVQSWIDDDILAAGLFDMLDAIGKGFSVMEVDWREHLGHTCPREFIWRPQRWFTFDRIDGETVLLREPAGDQPLAPHKFVVHRAKSKSGQTIRSGIARVASWAWMYKSFTLKDWAIFCQNFGMPIRIGKYGRNATDEEKDTLWRAVANIAGDCAAIIPSDMLIEFQEVAAKGASTDMYERRADWMDRQISKAVLGQTTTTDAVSGGHAVAQEHRLVQEDIERSDAIALSATVNRQIVPNLVAFEFGPQDHYPKVRIGRPDEVPLKDFADAFQKLAPLGLTAEADFLRGRLGIPAPAAGAKELVGGRQAPPALGKDGKPGLPGQAPGDDTTLNTIRRLMAARQQREDTDELVDVMSRRLEEDAAGALAGLTSEIREVLEKSETLAEAAAKLARMELSPDQLSDAMARGMALAHLAGQAALFDDLARRRK